MDELTWGPLADADLEPDLLALSRASLDVHGGLPMLGDAGFVGSLVLGGAATLGARDGAGRLVAAGGVRETTGDVVTTGFVHPSRTGEGLGGRLLAWAREQAEGRPLQVRTECLSDSASSLYARAGLSRTFAERVMSCDLRRVDEGTPAPPPGVELVAVRDHDRLALYDVYREAFADRPGFPDPSAEEWLADLVDDSEWDLDLSRVAVHDGRAVGFVNVVGSWIDQVGVVPTHRRRGVAGALLRQALAGLRGARKQEAWLTVEVANPAVAAYTALGFRSRGVRARFS